MSQRSRYFAFGSNMRISQMAERCPSSLFEGKAILYGWRWQINERGVANIIPSQSHTVEGLVFLVNSQEERSLDRNEGVRRDLYDKRRLPIQLEALTTKPLKTTYLAQQLQDGRNRAAFLERQQQDRSSLSGNIDRQEVEALVYVSSQYTGEGYIRTEFAERMKFAIRDAILLGMSTSYIGRSLWERVNGLQRRPDEPNVVRQHPAMPLSRQERAVVKIAPDDRGPLRPLFNTVTTCQSPEDPMEWSCSSDAEVKSKRRYSIVRPRRSPSAGARLEIVVEKEYVRSGGRLVRHRNAWQNFFS